MTGDVADSSFALPAYFTIGSGPDSLNSGGADDFALELVRDGAITSLLVVWFVTVVGLGLRNGNQNDDVWGRLSAEFVEVPTPNEVSVGWTSPTGLMRFPG